MKKPEPLHEGEQAPDFATTDDQGTEVSSANLKGSSFLLYFYPRDNTSGCTVQACDFRDSFARFSGSRWRVIGVSTDSASSHKKFIDKNELPFELIVDEEATLHEAYNTWREKNMYGNTYMGTLRSTFVISPDGSLKWVKYKVSPKGHVEQLLSDLEVN